MKTILLIFSIYLLVLPGIACAGEAASSDDTENTSAQTTSHTDHEDEEDGCGSFCSCSCCVHIVSVNFQSPQIILAKPFTKRQLLSFYNNVSLPSNYFGNIWQPPRIS